MTSKRYRTQMRRREALIKYQDTIRDAKRAYEIILQRAWVKYRKEWKEASKQND